MLEDDIVVRLFSRSRPTVLNTRSLAANDAETQHSTNDSKQFWKCGFIFQPELDHLDVSVHSQVDVVCEFCAMLSVPCLPGRRDFRSRQSVPSLHCTLEIKNIKPMPV